MPRKASSAGGPSWDGIVLFKKAAAENDTEKQYGQVASRSILQYHICIPLFERVACSVVAFILAQQSFSNQSMKWYS